MTDLERFFRLLVQTLADHDPAALREPLGVGLVATLLPYRTVRRALGIDVNEDYEALILRLAAGEQGLAVAEPPEARASFVVEAASPHPDLGVLARYATATLTLDTEALAYALGPGDDAPPSPVIPERPRAAPLLLDTMEFRAAVEQFVTAPPPPPEERPEPVIPADLSPLVTMDFATELAGFAPPVPVEPAPPPPGPVTIAFDLEPADRVVDAAPATPPTGDRCPFCGGTLPGARAVNFCPHCGENVRTTRCNECHAEVEYGWRFCVTCGSSLAE